MRTVERALAPSRRATRSILRSVVEVEAVARLDLDRVDAFGDQRAARQRRGTARPRWPRASRATVETNAAAGAGDLLVARAREAQLELARAVAAVDEMGVAIDESRRDPAAFAIDARRSRAAGSSASGPAKTMRPARRDQRAAFDHAECRAIERSVASRALRRELDVVAIVHAPGALVLQAGCNVWP